MRILLVEDDAPLAEALQHGLRQEGYTVDHLASGDGVVRALSAEPFDILILDLGLPHTSGIHILQHLRLRKIGIPVLILTARDEPGHKVAGLDAGADDYMPKPFDLSELCARLRALTRRASGQKTRVYSHGNLRVDPIAHSVTVDEQLVNMPPKEFAILEKLLTHTGKVLSRDQLSQTLYGWGDEADSNAVEVYIHNIRKKIGSHTIRTIRGVGYIIDPVAPTAE